MTDLLSFHILVYADISEAEMVRASTLRTTGRLSLSPQTKVRLGQPMKGKVLGVIPARLASTRFPGKVLHPYHGRPLLYYVWRDVRRSRMIDRLVIATDSSEVLEAALGFGAEAVRTSSKCGTGTDRVAEAAAKLGAEIIVNIQADNFGLKASTLNRVLTGMKAQKNISAATLAFPISSDKDLFDPNLVKLVADRHGNAAWFSRYPIPYIQRPDRGSRSRQHRFLGHIGVYFYRQATIEQFVRMKRTPAERAESLEQLRLLENGVPIRLFITRGRTVSVDTAADLRKLSAIYK